MRADLVGLVPFLNETGNIALFACGGAWIQLAVLAGDRADGVVDAGLSSRWSPAIFRVFGIHTPHSFFAVVFLNILFSTATCVPVFYSANAWADWEWPAVQRGSGRFFPTR